MKVYEIVVVGSPETWATTSTHEPGASVSDGWLTQLTSPLPMASASFVKVMVFLEIPLFVAQIE